MNYNRLNSIEEFGSYLLTTQDLDPLYVALVKAKFDTDQIRRWLLAYWCCYNAGASSWLSEHAHPGEFWAMMRNMAGNVQCPIEGRWPRGHERRHFRGRKAVNAVETMSKQFPFPEQLVSQIAHEGPSFKRVRAKVMELPQFGPWIAFKVADMLERIMGVPINFANADVMMFEQPFQSAIAVYADWALKGKMPMGSMTDVKYTTFNDKEKVQKVAQALLKHFGDWTAPPIHENIGENPRGVNIQEVETILCKFKSHSNGSYPLGLDSRELRHGLAEWAEVSITAKRLLEFAPYDIR